MNTQPYLARLLAANGFDREQHERLRADLKRGRIGLAQNRLPASTVIEDVRPGDVTDARGPIDPAAEARGRAALAAGEVAVVSLAAGAGSRWTQGAGVVKALHPFARLAGRHRTFLEVHLAKTRRSAALVGSAAPHVFTTGYLTHEPVAAALAATRPADPGPVVLSRGLSVGLRLVPMERDLRFAWEETAHQVLDEQKQKVRDSRHAALIGWARGAVIPRLAAELKNELPDLKGFSERNIKLMLAFYREYPDRFGFVQHVSYWRARCARRR